MSLFPADREARADLNKSSFPAMERAVDDAPDLDDVASIPKALVDWMHIRMAAQIWRKSFIVEGVLFELTFCVYDIGVLERFVW